MVDQRPITHAFFSELRVPAASGIVLAETLYCQHRLSLTSSAFPNPAVKEDETASCAHACKCVGGGLRSLQRTAAQRYLWSLVIEVLKPMLLGVAANALTPLAGCRLRPEPEPEYAADRKHQDDKSDGHIRPRKAGRTAFY